MQYLYKTGLYYFMDLETYEQLPMNKDQWRRHPLRKENTTSPALL
jgi:translation elongation factor P/translation initiation factor 5A